MTLLTFCATAYVAVHVFATWAGRVASILRRLWPGPTELPKEGVTCLKPLCGIDADLVENLESYAGLATQQPIEIILVLEHRDDAACPIAQAFAARHPNLVRILYGHAPNSGNAKVAALMRAAPEARYPLLWVTDSNLRVNQSHFDSMLSAWQAKQAKARTPTLVYAPISADGNSSIGTRLARLHITSHINWGREIGRLSGSQAMVGKSWIIHKEHLPAVGGIEAFKDSIGEDFLMAQAMNKKGAVGYSREAALFWLGSDHTIEDFNKRQLRWAQIRAYQMPYVYFGAEHFSYIAIPTLFTLAGFISVQTLAGIILGQMLLDLGLLRVHLGRWCFGDVLLYPIKELLVFTTYLRGMWRGKIEWRGRAMSVVAGGKFEGEKPS